MVPSRAVCRDLGPMERLLTNWHSRCSQNTDLPLQGIKAGQDSRWVGGRGPVAWGRLRVDMKLCQWSSAGTKHRQAGWPCYYVVFITDLHLSASQKSWSHFSGVCVRRDCKEGLSLCNPLSSQIPWRDWCYFCRWYMRKWKPEEAKQLVLNTTSSWVHWDATGSPGSLASLFPRRSGHLLSVWAFHCRGS